MSLLTATVASAADHRFGSGHFSRGRWTYTPVFDASNSVVGFLALAKPGTTLGENINAVWLERQGSGAGSTWSSAGWYLGDQALAARSVATALSISEESLSNLPFDIGDEALGSLESETPAPMARGLFSDDPLQSLLESTPAPGEAVEELVSVGYAAARIGDGGGEGELPPEEGCDEWMLAMYANAFSTWAQTQSVQQTIASINAVPAAWSCCLPMTVTLGDSGWGTVSHSTWQSAGCGVLYVTQTDFCESGCLYSATRVDTRAIATLQVFADCSFRVCATNYNRVMNETVSIFGDNCLTACPSAHPAIISTVGNNGGLCHKTTTTETSSQVCAP